MVISLLGNTVIGKWI